MKDLTNPVELGGAIRLERLSRDMTQREFAKFCGVSKSRISDYEMGKYPSVENLVRIATACDASLDFWLMP